MPTVPFDELEHWLGRQKGFPRSCSTAVAAVMSIYCQRSARPSEEDALLLAINAYLDGVPPDEPDFDAVRDQAQLLALELDRRRGGPWPLTPGPGAKVISVHHSIRRKGRHLNDDTLVKLFSAQILATELRSLAAAARIASRVVYPPLGLGVATDPSDTIEHALGRAKKTLVDFLDEGGLVEVDGLRVTSRTDWNPVLLRQACEERALTLRDTPVPLVRPLSS